MYPELLDEATISSPAEVLLYHAFRHQLHDDFTVFHSVAWLGLRRGARLADGEADFVIAHPRIGVLVLEVKGGIVGFDSASGWYTFNRAMRQRNRIRDPFEQAKDSKYALVRKLRSLPNGPDPLPTIGHAVAFPDGVTDLPELGPDAPRQIILLHDDLQDLDGWVRRCLGFWAQNNFVAPGETGVQVLQDLLARSWLMRAPRLGEEFDVERSAIDRYTDEQFQSLRFLAGRPRAAIRGCAGSGKTMLAVRKAQQLAAEGFHVLLTCYNRNLAAELRDVAGNRPRLKIRNYHALCREYAARTGFDRSSTWDESRPDFFDVVMPEALFEAAVTADPAYRFDAIIVDEGQDFAPSWWSPLELLLNDQDEGVLYIFYDDNQLVYPRELALPVDELPFCLVRNCRNTRAIYNSYRPYYRSDQDMIISGPPGRPVAHRTYDGTTHHLGVTLAHILAELTIAEEVPSHDVVLLSPRGLEHEPLASVTALPPFRLVPEPTRVPDHIYATTIRLFKGLERPVVILLAPNTAHPSFNELMYVGQSRARHHLILLTPASEPESDLHTP